jgi:hypothetical protein
MEDKEAIVKSIKLGVAEALQTLTDFRASGKTIESHGCFYCGKPADSLKKGSDPRIIDHLRSGLNLSLNKEGISFICTDCSMIELRVMRTSQVEDELIKIQSASVEMRKKWVEENRERFIAVVKENVKQQ